ncbi:conjugal transfer protein TraB [Rhizobium cauense]|uniref:conjugal transfer protein TraB n=1 Tax=Rhizobium cauense TaxID=1166683 RepID=UPI001C6EF3EF|nr:conjugal transfer protein TraB [Rhizobium cauense]MBW9114729.1 conjugal transfer protein TraB [Rhizobium cauense]
MRREYACDGVLAVAALATGCLAWSGHVLLLPASMLFPFLWSMTSHRSAAAVVSAVYFLAASRGLPQGVVTYYGSDLWPGLQLCLLASSSFVVVHTVLWERQRGLRKGWRYLVVCILMATPPFGILGWAHPITSAGVLFPGWGWMGLAATLAALAFMTTLASPVVAIVLSGFWIWSATHWTSPPVPPHWKGADLTLGASLGRDASLIRQQQLATRLKGEIEGAAVVVLPESALGLWTPTVERFWTRQLKGSDLTMIAGAAIVNGFGYDNVLVDVDRKGARIAYRERMPVPGSMWQPWLAWFHGSGGARAHFFANPVIDIGAARAAPLICYEQLIIWPVLQSMLYEPHVIVAVANSWWTVGTSIGDVQRASAQAWARLFGTYLVVSFNT